MTAKRAISLLICGDICPTNDTRTEFDQGNIANLFGGLAEKIKLADVSIANLECVLSERARPMDKIGPVLKGRPQYASVLAEAGVNLVGCANNHIKDCGPDGVIDTLTACADAGVSTTGAGLTAADAAEPAIIAVGGWTVGVMAVAEREFNGADDTQAGAHVFDPLEDLDRLRSLKASCDFVIVLYHGGIEYHPYASPGLQKVCRALVRAGADLVLCQHSHVIGSFEIYQGAHILYGQGNTLYGYSARNEAWNTGLVVGVSLRPSASAEIDFLPIGCDTRGRVDLLSDNHKDSCLKGLNQRSLQAQDQNFLNSEWEKFCDRLGRLQLPYIYGLSVWSIRINRVFRGLLIKLLYNRRERMTTLNVIRCDAHREVALTALRESLLVEKT